MREIDRRKMMLTGAAALLATTVRVPAARAESAPDFFDDFTGPAGSAPNPAFWAVVNGLHWGGQQNYTNENAYVDGNSHLVLKAVNNGGKWTSGRVQTAVPVYPGNNSQASSANLFTFGYGTLSASIQIPNGMGPGLWPAFWLLGANGAEGVPWPACGEIDVFEFASVATKANTSINGPFTYILPQDFQAQLRTPTPDLSTAFHTYWMIHAEDSLTFGVDSTTWGTFTPESMKFGGIWVFNQPFYLILNLAVASGGWVGRPDASTPSPAVMLVDWVKFEPAP